MIPLPDGISLQAAASTPVTYMTAHHMLHHLGHLRPEDKVLVHGGAGGWEQPPSNCASGRASSRWATSSKGKHHIIEHYGARPIDRHNEDFEAIIKEETGVPGWTTSSTLSEAITCVEASPASQRRASLHLRHVGRCAVRKTLLLKALFALRRMPKFDPFA